jgi:hypothetical protein
MGVNLLPPNNDHQPFAINLSTQNMRHILFILRFSLLPQYIFTIAWSKGWDKVGKRLLPPTVQHSRDIAQDLARLNNKGQLYFLPKDKYRQNVS